MIHARLALLLAAPLLLASCVLSPGKFVSALHIGKDRSFTFSYVGEVILLDPESTMGSGPPAETSDGAPVPAEEDDGSGEEDAVSNAAAAAPPPSPEQTAEKEARLAAERKAVLEALTKEAGYRSVEHIGGNKFRVDYQMSGRLDRGFAYPMNVDAKSIIPWIVVEVRKDGTARFKALAFGDPDQGFGSIAPPGTPDSQRDGTFTFTTDAALVMQNNEEGMAPGPGTRVVWKVTPASKTVPTAVVRF
jgi:hypothetical protein